MKTALKIGFVFLGSAAGYFAVDQWLTETDGMSLFGFILLPFVLLSLPWSFMVDDSASQIDPVYYGHAFNYFIVLVIMRIKAALKP